MKTTAFSLVAALLMPLSALAQQDPAERLLEGLPEEVAADVMARIEAAPAQGLPSDALAHAALEGITKGRSGEEVLSAVELLVGDLGRARDALRESGRVTGDGEIEAAAAAMRMGVDGDVVSALARSQPSGRSLSVPLLVIGGLTERGLPSDRALTAVQGRLTAGAGDAGLLGDFPEVGRELGHAMRPDQTGPALASGFAGFQVPVAGISVPVPAGPPAGGASVPAGPSGRPGPGGS
ncbi:MAG: hypothetical protein U5R14_00625 [Gemmatimonadota bacterium]|nr:hypothetical protein [Gemmatimonadota bacterium]